MTAGLVSYVFLCLGSLFAILSPFATIPTFLTFTEGNSPTERTRMAKRACTIAALVTVAFSLVGLTILGLFRVTVPAFQIAGGLVILRVAFQMLQGERSTKMTTEEQREGIEKEDISITPLAVPFLCGPGTITTAILLSSQAVTWFHIAVLLASVVIVYAVTFILLRLASNYLYLISEIAFKVIVRLMGLLLVSIAVQFVLDGLHASGLLGS
jgi:multiple antibiotic resistance protein